MTKRTLRSFWTEDQAAISPLYAVGILALVAVSGVGFDYGRLMALDSELQNAADQAALAAATQLDGNDDAMTRARDAATNALATSTSAFVNETRFANDKRVTQATSTRPITDLSFAFYDDYSNDTVGDLLTSDDDGAEARVVEVTVNSRRVFYALTPVVGAINSGPVIGKAMAALESGTCEVAPMFFCLPKDSSGNNILDFPTSADIGRELRLHLRNNAQETFTPGNFGFLDVPYGDNNEGNRKLGLNEGLAGCFQSEPDQDTQTGSRGPEADALNSRVDLFSGPIQSNHCDDAGDFCPSENVKKDWVNVQKVNNNAAATCSPSPDKNGWIRYNAATDPGVPNPGYPDDASFTGIVGNGSWGPSTYISTQNTIYGTSYSVNSIPDENGNGSISRYEAFMWERDTATDLLAARVVAVGPAGSGGGNKKNVYCAYPSPVEADPWPASDDQKDRRILTVGAVACEEGYPNGSKPVRILRWVDLFLVRPVNGASDTEFFTEIIGPAKKANGDSGFQYFGRKKAVLIR